MLINYLPVLLFMVIAVGLVGMIVLLSEILGKKKHFPAKDIPYECGMDPIGDARSRYSVRFYVIAMFFIVFDIEAIFLYPWAVIFKSLGWFGFVEMLVFIGILVVGLVYVWGKGALEWE
ncbi:MAG: NADH-quinone oxidoreductase subunit A [Syntrophobacterales bacterium]|jgi:NADH-quinone oxidoreductase subunit A|nr:NADH-quinone oxidoreductase subunit A [Syntrophobacterales bacterium]